MPQYRSFLLRLWQEGSEETSITWYGEIESIQTGQKWQFSDPESMFNFMRAGIGGEPAADSGRGRNKPLVSLVKGLNKSSRP
jgi:hypothetical protein